MRRETGAAHLFAAYSFPHTTLRSSCDALSLLPPSLPPSPSPLHISFSLCLFSCLSVSLDLVLAESSGKVEYVTRPAVVNASADPRPLTALAELKAMRSATLCAPSQCSVRPHCVLAASA